MRRGGAAVPFGALHVLQGGEGREQDAGERGRGGQGDPGRQRLAIGVGGVGLRDDRPAADHGAVGTVGEDPGRLAHAGRAGGVGQAVREGAQVVDD